MNDITAIILTKNESKNIYECIYAIKEIVKRIVVVDSYSDDDTVEIAKKMGAEVYQHKFEGYSKQYRYAVEIANINTTWILRIDADERILKDQAKEISLLTKNNEATDVTGIVLRYQIDFMGKLLKHGGAYPWKKLAIYKTGVGNIEMRNMDEHIILDYGKVIESTKPGIHYAYRDLVYQTDKQNWYSTREMMDYIEMENNKSSKLLDKKTWLKMNVYYKLPLGFRAWLMYIYRLYFKLGFLDGKEGRLYAFLGTYFYRYLVDAKIYEQKKMKFDIKPIESFKTTSTQVNNSNIDKISNI